MILPLHQAGMSGGEGDSPAPSGRDVSRRPPLLIRHLFRPPLTALITNGGGTCDHHINTGHGGGAALRLISQPAENLGVLFLAARLWTYSESFCLLW